MRMHTRILGAVLIVVALVCAAFLTYVLHQDRAQEFAALDSRIARTHERMQLALPGPLYDGNVEQVGAYIDSVFQLRDLLQIDLTEAVGDTRIERRREAAGTAGRRLEFRVPIARGEDTLGEVRTLWSTAGIESGLAAKRDRLLLFALALMATVGTVIHFVARSFTRPIDRLAEAALAMAEGDLDRRIEVDGMQELAALGGSFNRMRDAIRRKMADLAENNRRLQEEAEQRLAVERERDRQASILEATTDIVSFADPTGRVLYLNRVGRTLLGIAPQGELAVMIPQMHPDWAARIILEQGLLVALRDGVWSGETALRVADGSEIPVSQVILRHLDAQGRVEYLSTIMRDISERKQTERALREFNAELERRVEQRTVLLAASRDEADRANQAKSQFLSRMSHELRTPMNAILGFAQLLELDPQLGDKRRNWVGEIIGGGRHLLELINEVLDLSRVESGRFTISPEAVALRPLIDECLTLLRPLAAAGNVRLPEAARHCRVRLRADRTRLKQVLLNLLSNAIKYNRPHGSVHVMCVAEPEATPPAVRVRITDSGHGLTPQQLARLFVPFERLGADERQIEGTGIGLVLSRKLVEVMGGLIGVESTPGSGSTFWVRLPLEDGAEDDTAVPAAIDAAPGPAGASIRRRDVLCIEDNPANLRLIEAIFAHRRDVRLLTALSPGLGLELARSHRPALVLLDINLPEMDGYAVLQCLRENATTRAIPVLAISANAMPRDIERGKAAGFAGYVTKPVDSVHLLRLVDGLLAPDVDQARGE